MEEMKDCYSKDLLGRYISSELWRYKQAKGASPTFRGFKYKTATTNKYWFLRNVA
jgi:hypothetical protein